MKHFTLFLALFIVGCGQSGPKLFPVEGTLTRGGVPLADVRVEFRKTETGVLCFAETDANGKFKLTHTHGKSGAEPGSYIVSVFQKGKTLPLPAGVKAEDLPEEQRNPMSPEVPIMNADKTPIQVEISAAGDKDLKIDIR